MGLRASLPCGVPRLCPARRILPRLCQPYRAQTKGKVERFIGYLKRSFWVPFVASMRQAGLKPDKHAANGAVGRWLRQVANARVHATTNAVPAKRLVIEQAALQALPAPYRGRSTRSLLTPVRKAVVGYQHPLAVYENLMPEVRHEQSPARAHHGPGAGPAADGTAGSLWWNCHAANKKDVSYADFLEDVLKAERDARRVRSREILTRTAGFPALKTLEAYDFTFATGAPHSQSRSWRR